MDALVRAANTAQEGSPALVTAGARPTVVEKPAGLQTMVIRDEDSSTWKPGAYQLLVTCAGAGVLVAHFSLDGQSAVRELRPCDSGVSTDTLDVAITTPAH